MTDTIEKTVRAALAEDLGQQGDITSKALFDETLLWQGQLCARTAGILAGLEAARLAFSLLDPTIQFEAAQQDGAELTPSSVIATIKGNARAIFAAERTALNFLCHLSGIATLTNAYVQAVKPYKASICCTRKTTPNLRALEKHAVRMGGGVNHRFGLYDAVLIKDNHLALAGSVQEALRRVRPMKSDKIKIEIEVDTLEQLDELLALPADIQPDMILLDNMSLENLHKAVTRINERLISEASGGITLDNVHDVAATGVDRISIGALTHSAKTLDIGLDAL
ncbi:MAG: carboxylating nicotinate-nucleotide diphosphorylase [Alphaproteobacteria bacterium]|nr:carboxylating nicotinate-nucleotide diphosphorylase [Alphaproteobacteria bacterium]